MQNISSKCTEKRLKIVYKIHEEKEREINGCLRSSFARRVLEFQHPRCTDEDRTKQDTNPREDDQMRESAFILWYQRALNWQAGQTPALKSAPPHLPLCPS
jgi:hypothetical protein